MKQRNWVLTTVVVGLLGCSGGDDGPSTIPGGGGATPTTTGGSSGGGGTATTGALPPPTTGGTNSNGGTTAGTTSNGGGGDDGGVCDEKMVSSQRIAPKMLIVLDKSGSMGPSGNDQMIDRWGGSVDALKAITMDLQDSIKFGLMTYPQASGGGGGGSTCTEGKVDVPIAAMNAAPIAAALDGMEPRGGTPTAGTLEVAKTLFDQPVTVDDVNAPEYVLLVTDGSPNCYMGGAGNMADPAAIAASVDLIGQMAQNDTKTYVIGYQTAQDAALSAALDQMAAVGGTGDTKHRPVEDRDMLVKAFRDIAAKAVSCTFLLDEAPPDPTYVQVTIDGKQVNFNEADGWILSPDGLQITLQGAACQGLQGDGQHTVAVKVKCEVVSPM
jgi:hypothetical protein